MCENLWCLNYLLFGWPFQLILGISSEICSGPRRNLVPVFIRCIRCGVEKMGGCVSTSSRSTCSSRGNGKRVSPSCMGIGICRRKRTKKTFADHVNTLQHLPSIPNRIFTNGKSRASCIFTQQGRKGINQDAMIVWEVSSVVLNWKHNYLCLGFNFLVAFFKSSQDFMSDDVTFCGVFDGHGPHGHLVARKVRDALPLKLLSFLHSYQSRQNGSSTACFKSDLKKLDGGDSEKDCSTEDKLDCLWREAFLKSYKAMDKELRSHPNLDCFCSGSTAVTIVRQVQKEPTLLCFFDLFSFFVFSSFHLLNFWCQGFKSFHGIYWGFTSNLGIQGQQWFHGGNPVDSWSKTWFTQYVLFAIKFTAACLLDYSNFVVAMYLFSQGKLRGLNDVKVGSLHCKMSLKCLEFGYLLMMPLD